MTRFPLRGPLRPAGLCLGGLLVLCLLPAGAQAATCVREDEAVRISGQIQRQRMTRLVSDRNNGTRTQRDLVVTILLREPLCVMLPDDVSLAMRPRRIKEIELLRHDRLPAGRDGGIMLDGRVTLASSNAHHMPVLVEVQGVSTARKAAQPAPTRNAVQPTVSGNTTLAAARTFPR